MKYLYIICFFFFILRHASAQEEGVITIDDGAAVSNDYEGKVTLKLFARGAVQMQVSNNGSFIGARWQAFSPRIAWKLINEEGIKTVYAKFRDSENNLIASVEASIELDRQAPTNLSLMIDSAKKITNIKDRIVKLDIGAEGAVQMQVSSRKDFAGALWIPFTKQKMWQLPGLDGIKFVYIRFMDNAGNISDVIESSIILDRLPPMQPRVVINNGETFTNSPEVTLSLMVKDAFEVLIQGNANWIPYTPTLKWTFADASNGEKVVQVRYRDEIGNISELASDNIILDMEAPILSQIAVNNGNKYTRESTVPLRISAIGAAKMMISNHADYKGANWQNYNSTLAGWDLGDTDGTKIVYAKFQDLAGNETETVSGDVVLDRMAPKALKLEIIIQNGSLNEVEPTVNLKIYAEDAKYMMLSNTPTFYGVRWESYRSEYEGWKLENSNLDGNKTIYAKFRDQAGNTSESISANVRVDRTGPVDCQLKIDRDAEFTTNRDKMVTLSLQARGATEMLISEDTSFTDAKWVAYQTNLQYQLTGEDGLKQVFAKFRDEAGNESKQTASDKIVMDRGRPYEGEIIINRGDLITNNIDKSVLLHLKAKDATKMMVANDSTFKGARWQSYSPENISWNLVGDDGLKIVYAKFMDNSGNESLIYYDSISLDRKPPIKGSVKILAENTQINIQTVQLALSAEGADEMIIANDFKFATAKWETYRPQKTWTLVGEDGIKAVFVKFRKKPIIDRTFKEKPFANESSVVADKIGLDTKAPQNGSIRIDNSAKCCTDINKHVLVRLSTASAEEMMVSNFEDFRDAKWQPYQFYLQDWVLDGEDGEKKVFAKFRDKAGNESQPVSATILLDRQEPYDVEFTIDSGKTCTNNINHKVKLQLKATGAVQMAISNTPSISNFAWENYKESKEWALAGRIGVKTIYVKFKDDAGNESKTISAMIMLDNEPPNAGTMLINNGRTLTKDSRIALTFNARNADEMLISNTPDFKNAEWENYISSKAWYLDGGAGLKRVYVKFRDNCKNESIVVSKEITLVTE
ncbi:MAG: hypothetical protein EAZ08_13770 [Cytophagales bacterium]|nr:MAG: hypothetical protein EAZ08_13770 [Cytophagales bacterium]